MTRNLLFSLLIVLSVSAASADVLQRGEFSCNEVANSMQEFKGAAAQVSQEQNLQVPMIIWYEVSTKPEARMLDERDLYEYKINVESSVLSHQFGNRYLHSDAAISSYIIDDEKLLLSDSYQRTLITLSRVYLEDWQGFLTRAFDGSSITLSLNCKRTKQL